MGRKRTDKGLTEAETGDATGPVSDDAYAGEMDPESTNPIVPAPYLLSEAPENPVSPTTGEYTGHDHQDHRRAM